MKITLLFAILTAGLNQAGMPQFAELAYVVAASLALTQGGPAVVQAVTRGRKSAPAAVAPATAVTGSMHTAV